MKVIQINAVYGYGSTGVIVKDIENALLEEGNESRIVYQHSNLVKTDINGLQMGNVVDWKIHAILTRVLGKQGYASGNSTKRLIKYLETEKPDIVHLHNLHANYININQLLSYLAKKNIATILTLHDCWFFTGKCFHFTMCGCEKWKIGCGKCPQNKEDVKSLFWDKSKQVFKDKKEKFQAIQNLTIVGCSDWIKNLAKESPIFRNKQLVRIYNGVDTDIFHPKKENKFRETYGLTGQFIILGMANKWLQDMNKETFRKIRETLLPDELIVIVGCSEEQKSELKQYFNVLSIGYISNRNKLAEIYSAADVFVNMTFEDTLPTVNMESICCGTPVITYNSCGSPELISPGITGYVIPQKSVKELRNAINRIKQGFIDKEKCAYVGKNKFDKRRQYKEYLQLYDRVLEGKR